MIMKSQCVCRKMMILGICLFAPSIASAHGVTKELVVSVFLVADFVVLGLVIWTYFLSKSLCLRWSILFTGINIAVVIAGVLSNCITVYEKGNPYTTNFWFGLGAYSTGYLWCAVPLHLVVLLFLAFLRFIFKKSDTSKQKRPYRIF